MRPPPTDEERAAVTEACRAVLSALPPQLPTASKLDALMSSYLTVAAHFQLLQNVGGAMCAIGPVLRRGGSLEEAQAAATAGSAPPIGPTLAPDENSSHGATVADLAKSIAATMPDNVPDADAICAGLTFVFAVADTGTPVAIATAARLMRSAADELDRRGGSGTAFNRGQVNATNVH